MYNGRLSLSNSSLHVYYGPMSMLKKFVRLRPSDRRLLCMSSLLMVGMRFLLFFLPFRDLLKLVRQRAQSAARKASVAAASPERLAWAVRVAGRRFAPRDRPCLTQALVLLALFRHYGHPARLRIGVAKDEQDHLRAHAWVESKGRILIGKLPDLARYSTLPPLE